VQLFSQNTKVEALRRVPLFAGLSKKELEQLAKQAEDMEIEQGKTLCTEGETGREFFAIVEGEAEVTRGGRAIATRGAGDFVGEIALLADVDRTATVTAKTPLRVFVLTRQAFHSLVAASPGVEQKVLLALAERFASVTDDPCC
jgi:CRP-like cAMP-binding protein